MHDATMYFNVHKYINEKRPLFKMSQNKHLICYDIPPKSKRIYYPLREPDVDVEELGQMSEYNAVCVSGIYQVQFCEIPFFLS